jgi:uncharacterized protein (DUF1778 family)
MMNLSDTIKLFHEGEVTSDTIRLVLNTDMNDIVDAAEEIGEATDYVLESALEHARERAYELSDLAEFVNSYARSLACSKADSKT